MKWLVYNIFQREDEDGVVLSEKQMQWSEANLEIARAESYNGVEPEVIDDGQPEPVVEPTTDEILNAMLGVTE